MPTSLITSLLPWQPGLYFSHFNNTLLVKKTVFEPSAFSYNYIEQSPCVSMVCVAVDETCQYYLGRISFHSVQ